MNYIFKNQNILKKNTAIYGSEILGTVCSERQLNDVGMSMIRTWVRESI